MKKYLSLFGKILALCPIFLLVAGCVYTQVFPEEKHFFTVVTKDMDETRANSAAMEKAIRICKAEDRRVIILDHKSIYQGATDAELALAQLARKNLGTQPTMRTAHDYKVIFRFKCVEKFN